MTIKELIIKLINETDIRELDKEIKTILYENTMTGCRFEIETIDKEE